MIADPPQIKHSDDWYKLIKGKIGQTVFYKNARGDGIAFDMILEDKYPVSNSYDIFSINTRYKFIYCVLGAPTTREEFLEFLGREHPEYLEWFLFHQEWLC